MKICPKGWHLPSKDEWEILIDHYGGVFSGEAYKRLMEGGDSKFAALLCGQRYSNGEFDGLSEFGFYWSATERGSGSALFYDFNSGNAGVNRRNGNKGSGFSCRCLKD